MKIKQFIFIGVRDGENCSDCDKALSENPYKQNNVPIPGKLRCGKKCRHAVQTREIDASFLEWLKWYLN